MNDRVNAALSRYRPLIDDWPAFVDACARPLSPVVWENPLRERQRRRLARTVLGREDASVADLLATRGLRPEPLGWIDNAWRVEGLAKPGHTLEHALGLMHVQEEVSLAPPVVLAAGSNHRVLDLCAAPGGKTARIGLSMDNRGTLVANDIRPQRLRALRSNCERLGILNVVVTPVDGTRFALESGPFDRILLDVPCSCEGNLRTDARAALGTRTTSLAGRSGLQATLLGRAWKLLRPGGVLVYATCTFAPEENEMVLDYALGPTATIEPFEIRGLRAAAGITAWEGRAMRPDCRHLSRYWPHLNDTGGFTIAKIRKASA